MDDIVGYIERITFQNVATGYTVAKLKEKGKSALTCIVGYMPQLKPGETVSCKGEWKRHLVHGAQFEVAECKQEAPCDVVGVEKYLGSGLIKGIGPVYAKKIVQTFGVDTLTIIDKDPERLLEVKGLGKKKMELITTCWQDQRKIRDVMVFLQAHGVSPAYAQKIFKRYRENSIAVIQENPYRLAKEVFGIGFKMADAIAQSMGIEKDSPRRLSAGISFVFSQLAAQGHTCYPEHDFYVEGEKILEIPKENLVKEMEALILAEEVKRVDKFYGGKVSPFVAADNLYNAEKTSAKILKDLMKASSPLRAIDEEKAIDWVQKKLSIELAAQQKMAILASMREKVSITTGGPGTGKSTITKAILAITEMLTKSILLLAPTGRAAKRMQEITGKESFTIHAKLEVDFQHGGFKRNRTNPLEADLIIIDESSMIDTQLLFSLLQAVPMHARLIFVGDIDQLPSVGAGNVLKDLIQSKIIPTTQLTEIFRQAQGSKIITNSHMINRGAWPDLTTSSDSDFFFIQKNSPEEILETITSLNTTRLPQKYKLNPIDQIQVLAPMKKGIVGIDNLNVVLQQQLNPSKDTINYSGRLFAKGDKVMQIRNNYNKEVFNGDIGVIKELDSEENELLVQFDDREVPYEFADLDELVLAYAVSVHKYQGSECPAVIIPLHTSHAVLLSRNLLYTAVTRGKKLVILVGSQRALALAIHNNEPFTRYSGLKEALQDEKMAL